MLEVSISVFMKIILYSQSLLLFFRNGGKILLPPRAEAYMPTPEASEQGLRIIFIFPPHRAVFAVWLILFHLIVRRCYSPCNQDRLPCRPPVHTSPPSARTLRRCHRDTFPIHQPRSPYHSSFLLFFLREYRLTKFPSAVNPSQRGGKSPVSAGPIDAYLTMKELG